MMEQLSFAPNGNIMPCPYRSYCLNHPAGCKGESHWCKRIPEEKEKERWERKRQSKWKEQDDKRIYRNP